MSGLLAFVSMGAGWAQAIRPLTYDEAIEATATKNGFVVRAEHAWHSATAQARAARGLLDPVYGASATYGHLAFEDVRDALPISGNERTWDAATWITGTIPTGTIYTLGGGAGFNRSFASGLQPRYDENGVQVGTAPFEATSAAYSSNLTVTLTQHLLRGARVAYNLQASRVARQASTMAELVAEQARLQAMADAAFQYWTWGQLVQVHVIDVQAVQAAEEALRVATLQVEARQLAPVERTRLESAYVLAKATAVTSGVLANQARDLLLVSMGEAPGQPVEPASAPGDPPALSLDLPDVTAKALENNVDLSITRLQVETLDFLLDVTRHGRLPSLDAVATLGRTTGNQPTLSDAVQGLFGEAAQPSATVAAVLTVPLGNRAAAGAAEATEHDRFAAENAVLDLEHHVRAQVAYQVALLEGARDRVLAADTGVRLAEETLTAMETLAAASRAIPKDVLEARTLLDRARIEAVTARTEWRLAYTELARLQADFPVGVP